MQMLFDRQFLTDRMIDSLKSRLLTHGCFYPHRLAARQRRHLGDVGKVKLAPLRPVVGRKHVLLPRLAQQPFDRDRALHEAVRPCLLAAVLLADPPAVDENRGSVLALQRRNHHVAVLAVAHPRAYQHLLVMSKGARRENPAVIELVYDGGVDVRG